MPKLAIVSTYNENCGNASYTHVLKTAFAKHLDVDIIPLDIFLLQKKSEIFRKPADRHINELARKLADYDYVNIQFEAGLYGASIPDVLRRIQKLIKAAPNLILTMHRIDTGHFPLSRAITDAIRFRTSKPLKKRAGGRRYATMYRKIVNLCKEESKRKNVWIKVHTKRERRVVTEILNFQRCFDFPLAFLTGAERAEAKTYNNRAAFLKKHNFGENDTIIGLFGYISEYKGIETAIKSLDELPDNYKLAIFGSHHPQSIQAHRQIHPFLESLLNEIDEIDANAFGAAVAEARLKRLNRPSVQLRGTTFSGDDVTKPLSLKDRVRFIGSLPDPEFIEALRLADAAVLPYIEVGQSMSGVVVLGMEVGSRIVTANNFSFSETRKYYGDAFVGFDIGNYVELAQKVQLCVAHAESTRFEALREKAFVKYNIDKSIELQLEMFGFFASRGN